MIMIVPAGIKGQNQSVNYYLSMMFSSFFLKKKTNGLKKSYYCLIKYNKFLNLEFKIFIKLNYFFNHLIYMFDNVNFLKIL